MEPPILIHMSISKMDTKDFKDFEIDITIQDSDINNYKVSFTRTHYRQSQYRKGDYSGEWVHSKQQKHKLDEPMLSNIQSIFGKSIYSCPQSFAELIIHVASNPKYFTSKQSERTKRLQELIQQIDKEIESDKSADIVQLTRQRQVYKELLEMD